MLMTATEKLSQVLQGGYNLEFEIVEVIKDSKTIAKIEETIYIRQGGPLGGFMTVLNYSYAIEDIQKCGAMRNFNHGHYDFLANWQVVNKNPLTLLQKENDTITSIKLTAIDNATTKDINMEIMVGDFVVRCSKCRYIF